jgi:hypothetical protein
MGAVVVTLTDDETERRVLGRRLPGTPGGS